MEEHNQPHSCLCQLLPHLAHGGLPGRRVGIRRRRPIRIGEPIARIFTREFVVLEIVFDWHGKTVLPETEREVQWSDRCGGLDRVLSGGRRNRAGTIAARLSGAAGFWA